MNDQKQSNSTQLSKTAGFSPEVIKNSNLDAQKELPSLQTSTRHFVPLTIEYWTPTEDGEEKLVYIHSVGIHQVPDMETGEVKELECVMMLEKQGDVVRRFINAGRVLVGNIKDAVLRGEIVPGTTLTPISITYMGKVKNKSNARMSNRWQIIPLVMQS